MTVEKTSLLTSDPNAGTPGKTDANANGGAGDKKQEEKKTEQKTDANANAGDKKVDDKKPEEKPGEKKTEDKKEIVYDLKLPEKALLKEDSIAQVTEFAKANGLSNEAAQKMLEHTNSTLAAHEKAIVDGHAEQVDLWVEMVKNDKVLGGEKFKETANDAYAATMKFASPELRKMLVETGYGNHPEMIRMMSAIGRSMRDSKIVLPDGNGDGAPKNAAEIMYPSTKA